MQITEIEIPPGVYFKCLGVLGDLTEFGAADAGIGLAWWAANNQVDRVLDRTQAEFRYNVLWLDLRNVVRFGMKGFFGRRGISEKIISVGRDGMFIDFERGNQFASQGMEA
jgi:hypothetical protein